MDDDPKDRVSLEGLDPVAALKALLVVDPDALPSMTTASLRRTTRT
jgi:hypothetical protein